MSVRIIGPRDPKVPNALNVTSSSKTWTRELSPMLLGPVVLPHGFVACNVENAWQYSKVYPEHVDEDCKPSSDYWQWAIAGWEQSRAVRYPMGKGAIPLFLLWGSKRLGYIEARKQIYAPIYGEAVLQSPAWAKLKTEYQGKNQNLTLFDYDGYDHQALGMSLSDVLHDPTRKMGHAFVLAMMLESGI